ncbi:MAG: hypothetical protein FWF77_00200 [Defluviitaleaceae bacterium]|nr:hypothetical protein [Defluviitaleaceae bacterium]
MRRPVAEATDYVSELRKRKKIRNCPEITCLFGLVFLPHCFVAKNLATL